MKPVRIGCRRRPPAPPAGPVGCPSRTTRGAVLARRRGRGVTARSAWPARRGVTVQAVLAVGAVSGATRQAALAAVDVRRRDVDMVLNRFRTRGGVVDSYVAVDLGRQRPRDGRPHRCAAAGAGRGTPLRQPPGTAAVRPALLAHPALYAGVPRSDVEAPSSLWRRPVSQPGFDCLAVAYGLLTSPVPAGTVHYRDSRTTTASSPPCPPPRCTRSPACSTCLSIRPPVAR